MTVGGLTLSADGSRLTVRVPMTVKKRGGRKMLIAPNTPALPRPAPSKVDRALVKAVARAFRWQRMLEEGKYASMTDLAKAERINKSYVSRLLGLTLLCPAVVEAILDGRLPPQVQLNANTTIPDVWDEQKAHLLGPSF